jgi:hypothetical protein
MDISQVVNYEKTFLLEVKHPITDEPFGLTMQIRSSGSEACKTIYRKHADEIIEMRYKGKRPKGKQAEKEELERTAASIASWDWSGEANYKNTKPVLSMALAIEVLDKVPWIYAQVKEAADRLENFSASSEPKSSES